MNHSIFQNATAISKPEIIHEEEKEAVEDTVTAPTEYVCELLMKDIQLDELPLEIGQVEECEQEKESISKESVGKITNEMEMQNKTSGIAELIKPLPEKVYFNYASFLNFTFFFLFSHFHLIRSILKTYIIFYSFIYLSLTYYHEMDILIAESNVDVR